MPKRKSNPTTVEEIEKAALEIESDACEVAETPVTKKKTSEETTPSDVEEKRGELIKLAEDGDLDKSVAFVKKANKSVIEKLHTEYERKRAQKANEFLTDLLISKFASLLGGLDPVRDPEELCEELRKDELLKRDVHNAVQMISSYLPLLGILSGGITTAKHVAQHKFVEVEGESKEVTTIAKK